MPTQSLYPTLRYRDARAAVDFLVTAFGFEAADVSEEDGTIGHAELRFGSSLLMLGPHRERSQWPQEPGNAAVYVVVADPDAHHARAAAAGARVVSALVDQPYGSREYSARDSEGNLWSFGTYDPSASGGAVLDHLYVGVSDLDRSAAFYAGALEPLALSELFRRPGNVAFGRAGKPSFFIRSGGGREPVHLAFSAPDRATVDRFHAAALASGGQDNGAPGLREYHPSYYSAFVLDPNGHNIEAVCHR